MHFGCVHFGLGQDLRVTISRGHEVWKREWDRGRRLSCGWSSVKVYRGGLAAEIASTVDLKRVWIKLSQIALDFFGHSIIVTGLALSENEC